MKPFTFRHYWDEKTWASTVEPAWLTKSAEGLSPELKKIKQIADKLLDPGKYAQISRQNTDGNEVLDGHYVYYRLVKKSDPDPTNNRIATDITFCISKHKLNPKQCSWEATDAPLSTGNRNMLSGGAKLAAVFVLVALLTFAFWSNMQQEHTQEQTVGQKRDTDTQAIQAVDKPKQNVSQTAVFKRQAKRLAVDTLCKEEFGRQAENVANYCFEMYVYQRCKKGLRTSYDKWLKNVEKKNELIYKKCLVVENAENDRDLNAFLKNKNRKTRKMIKRFLQGEI